MPKNGHRSDIRANHAYVVSGVSEKIVLELKKHIAETLDVSFIANPDFFHGKFETLTIDDSRKIQEIHSSKPFSSDMPRIFIVEIYGTTREAQNALLKIIEEPQPGNYFFFVVPLANILLPTILSRVQMLDIEADVNGNAETNAGAGRDADAFILMSLSEKIAYVDGIAADISDEKKAKHEAIAFLNSVEKKLYDAWVKNRSDKNALKFDVSRKQFETIARARDYVNDRAPSVKMLLEYVALSL